MERTGSQIIHQLFNEIWNKDNCRAIQQILNEDCLVEPTLFGESSKGPRGYRDLVNLYKSFVPKLEFSFVIKKEKIDGLSLEWKAQGSHDGHVGNIFSTGQLIRINGSMEVELKSGTVPA